MSQPALSVRPRRRAMQGLGIVIGVLLTALVVWYVNSPADLPTSEEPIRASTIAGRPVYVGVFSAGSDFERALSLSGVKVHTTANTEVKVVPRLCRGGSLAVTTEPERFCDELVDPEGESFERGDSIVLEVSSDKSAIAVIDPIRLGFREGLQWGTREAGSGAIVEIRARGEGVS